MKSYVLNEAQAKRVNSFYRSALTRSLLSISDKEHYLSAVNRKTVDTDYLKDVEQSIVDAKSDILMIESIIKATE